MQRFSYDGIVYMSESLLNQTYKWKTEQQALYAIYMRVCVNKYIQINSQI